MKKYLDRGQYLTTQDEKRSIFLHHTVGTNTMSAWRWWNSTRDRVGTPYIIDRDGTIMEVFDPSMWAFHLGIRGDDNWQEKHSINIELVSSGPLRLEEGDYRFYPLWPNKMRFTSIPADEVTTLKKAYHGHKHWHSYTEAQYESLKWLIGRLYMDFPSLVVDNDLDKFHEYNKKVIDDHIPGIWAHSTVRKDKSDVVPFPELIAALKEVQGELVPPKPKTTSPKPVSKAKKSGNKKTKPKS